MSERGNAASSDLYDLVSAQLEKELAGAESAETRAALTRLHDVMFDWLRGAPDDR